MCIDDAALPFFLFVILVLPDLHPGVDIDRVVRDAKRIFCNTPRTASMRRHDKLFADPSVKHVSQTFDPLFHRETFVMCQVKT